MSDTITIKIKREAIDDFSHEELCNLRTAIWLWSWCDYTEHQMNRKTKAEIRKIRERRVTV